MAEIVQLLVSPVHRYAGRPDESVALSATSAATDELTGCLQLRAGLGVVGDRYFNQRAHRDAAVSVMSVEALAPWPGADLRAVRRNVLVRGVDVDAGLGRLLALDTGDGPVRLRLHRRAHPCRWMDLTVGDGAWRGLRGHGGVRCEPLDDGVLRVGPVEARWLD